MLPRFKYFISLSEILSDGISLLFSDMNDSKQVVEFENELKRYFGRNYCYTTSSFRMGAYYYLKSLNLKPGSEVLVTPITIPDLINVILLLDLKPVFVDLNQESHAVDIIDLQKKLSPQSKVLIITYLSGMVASHKEILKLTKEHNIKIIEDISQAYGSVIDGKCPYIGDIQIGSLSSGKLISTYTGGFSILDCNKSYENILNVIDELSAPPKKRFVFEILSNIKIYLATSKLTFPLVYSLFWFMWRFKPDFMKSIAKSKMYTRSEENDIFFDDYPIRRKEIPAGWKTKLCSWQAKVGLRFLKQLDVRMKKRQSLGKILYSSLNDNVRLRIPKSALNKEFNFYHIPLKLKKDKYVELKEMFSKGIDSEGYGLNLCNTEEVFSDISCDLPEAFVIKHHSVFIPLHESYSEKDMIKVAKGLNSNDPVNERFE